MKQYYESEVLFQLMEREGFNIPSSVPPYESEIKAYLINQVKQAYPKLTDYEAEWLLYNYTKHLPAEFPISSVTNATSATFENVVPFAYQSAILKGDTKFINEYGVEQADKTIFHSCYFEQGTIGGDIGYIAVKEDSTLRIRTINPLTLEIGSYSISVITGYEVFVKIIDSTNNKGIRQAGFGSSISFNITDSSKEKVYIVFRKNDNTTDITTDEVEGIVSLSTIPELTSLSLVSVKAPVLTTTGKNLFDYTHWYPLIYPVFDYEIVGNKISATIPVGMWFLETKQIDFSELKMNTVYTISGSPVNSEITILFWKPDGAFIFESGVRNTPITFRTPNEPFVVSMRFCRRTSSDNSVAIQASCENIQIEEGSVATSFESYKSNILTVNEEVELRGIGDVKDELNLLTGELTQRIGEIVLDGSEGEGWSIYTNNREKTVQFRFDMKSTAKGQSDYTKIISNNLPSVDIISVNDTEGVSIYSNGNIYISLLRTKATTLSDLNVYLQSNPITIQYELAEKPIKTVDLTTVNENGETTHFMPLEGTMSVQSSGETIQPTFDMSVPVEATTQNLASFIDLEMEE